MSIDQKRLFHKIKYDLEEWRELILIVNSILKWEKNFYPGMIFGIITIFFLILWYLDLSMLTLVSLFLLGVGVADYIMPKIIKILFKTENWTGIQENKYEEICHELCKVRVKLHSLYNLLFTAKEKRSTAFTVGLSVTLLLLAWIGAVIDNLLLSYLLALLIGFYPGLYHNGFISSMKNQFTTIISAKLQQLKEKVTKTE